MKHIILFGDSLFGRFGRDYILALESSLKDAVVYNCAAGGFDTRHGLRRAEFISRLNAEYVCISLGVNDCNPSKEQPVPIEEFEKNLEAIVKTFSNSHVVLFPCPPIYDANDLKETESFNATLNEYNNVMKRIASDTKSYYIDSAAIYGSLLKDGEDYHTEDGLHLNEKGYAVLIDELVKVLK